MRAATHRPGAFLVVVLALVGLIAGCTAPAGPSDQAETGETGSPTASTSPESSDGATEPSTSPTSTSGPDESDTATPSTSPPPSPPPPPASPTPTPTPTPDRTDSTAPPTAGDVDVSIVFAGLQDGVVVVSSFVAGIVEEGGSCTATLTSGQGESSASASAIPDATATWCEELRLDASGVREGDTVTVDYSSPRHAGRSLPTPVTLS